MSGIGDRIRARREELGLTQEELAAKMGYKNKSTITKIESGVNDVSQSKVVRFAKALETTTIYLMGVESKNSDTSEAGVQTFAHPKSYYENDDTRKIAQKVFDDPNLRVLFDAASDATPEDILTAAELLRKFKDARRD